MFTHTHSEQLLEVIELSMDVTAYLGSEKVGGNSHSKKSLLLEAIFESPTVLVDPYHFCLSLYFSKYLPPQVSLA